MMPDFQPLLSLARDISADAARFIGKDIDRYQKVEQDLDRDVKVFADKKLESVIVKQLLEGSQYPVLSEESGLLGGDNKNSDYCWIVDPLDGSLNFSRGIPINCISIALWKGMEPIMGVVYDFNRNETFSGLVGRGAWLNSNPIRIGKISNKSNAILCTGFPVSTDFSKKSLLNFVEQIRKYKKVRILGSAALSLAYVACGRSDVYLENDIMLWDVAAGIALVKAAGGIVQYSSTQDINVLRVFAGNQSLSQLVSTKEESSAGRPVDPSLLSPSGTSVS